MFMHGTDKLFTPFRNLKMVYEKAPMEFIDYLLKLLAQSSSLQYQTSLNFIDFYTPFKNLKMVYKKAPMEFIEYLLKFLAQSYSVQYQT